MTLDELLLELDSGAFNTEATREIREMVEALDRRARERSAAKGEITIKLSFTAAATEKAVRVEIETELRAKRPGPARSKETRWIGEKGTLLASDPRQVALPLKLPGKAERKEGN